jgi:hypothetical protein
LIEPETTTEVLLVLGQIINIVINALFRHVLFLEKPRNGKNGLSLWDGGSNN